MKFIVRLSSERLASVGALGIGLVMVVASGGCSSSSASDTSGGSCTPDTAGVEHLFATSCAVAGCHRGANAAAQMDLSTDPLKALVDVPSSGCPGETRVLPGDPSDSLLYKKLMGTSSCGSRMPLKGSLSAEQESCIASWIASLPPDDAGLSDAGPDATDAGDAPSCSASELACGSSCVDPQTDTNHCGSCGHACSAGASCQAGQCSCASGLAECAGACTDLGADPKNCGSCGNACAAGQVCANGSCGSSCGSLTTCNGLCVDTQSSATNCGGCGKVCPSGASCSAGQCVCPSGTSACGGSCIDTATDPSNCGACGTSCGGGQTCQSGACKCPTGQALCNGACANVQTDTSNCGGCGNVCAIGQACSSGACQCGTSSVSFSAAVQPIFSANCALAGCHAGAAPQQGMNLSTGKAYAALVNVLASECTDGRKRVLPGQPTQSYIIDKLMGVDLCSGTKMPKTGSVSNGQIQTLADWICEGAPNN